MSARGRATTLIDIATSSSSGHCRTAAARYGRGTANMQGGPAASPSGGVVESISAPACASRSDIDWVPEREAEVVPDEAYALCISCPFRQGCLERALASGSDGYWAGTTLSQREAMVAAETSASETPADDAPVEAPVAVEDLLAGADVHRAEVLAERKAALAREQAEALHAPGQGSLRWYRRGCHCGECRGANATRRARQIPRRTKTREHSGRQWAQRDRAAAPSSVLGPAVPASASDARSTAA